MQRVVQHAFNPERVDSLQQPLPVLLLKGKLVILLGGPLDTSEGGRTLLLWLLERKSSGWYKGRRHQRQWWMGHSQRLGRKKRFFQYQGEIPHAGKTLLWIFGECSKDGIFNRLGKIRHPLTQAGWFLV